MAREPGHAAVDGCVWLICFGLPWFRGQTKDERQMGRGALGCHPVNGWTRRVHPLLGQVPHLLYVGLRTHDTGGLAAAEPRSEVIYVPGAACRIPTRGARYVCLGDKGLAQARVQRG